MQLKTLKNNLKNSAHKLNLYRTNAKTFGNLRLETEKTIKEFISGKKLTSLKLIHFFYNKLVSLTYNGVDNIVFVTLNKGFDFRNEAHIKEIFDKIPGRYYLLIRKSDNSVFSKVEVNLLNEHSQKTNLRDGNVDIHFYCKRTKIPLKIDAR